MNHYKNKSRVQDKTGSISLQTPIPVILFELEERPVIRQSLYQLTREVIIMIPKNTLFCLGTREELIELQNCIKGLAHAGHQVYILYNFAPIPLLDMLGARVYAGELPPTPMFEKMLLDLVVFGHQYEPGKTLVPRGNDRKPLRVLYQGIHQEAGSWLDVHERLHLVWGLTADIISDWDQMEHNPWIGNGKGNQEVFSAHMLEILSDD